MIVISTRDSSALKFPFRAIGEPVVFLTCYILTWVAYVWLRGRPRHLWRSSRQSRVALVLSLIASLIVPLFFFSAGWPYALIHQLIIIMNYDNRAGQHRFVLPLWILNAFWLLALLGVPRNIMGAGLQFSTIDSCTAYYVMEVGRPTLMCDFYWLMFLEALGAVLIGSQFLLTAISYIESELLESPRSAPLAEN